MILKTPLDESFPYAWLLNFLLALDDAGSGYRVGRPPCGSDTGIVEMLSLLPRLRRPLVRN